MASNWSALKIQLMGTGENSGTWGNVTNTNLGDDVLGAAITGSADVTFASNNQTLTASNNQSSQTFRNLRLNLTGTTGGTTRTLTVPDIEKVYIVNNGCGDAVEVKNTSGVNVSVPANKTTYVFSTGTGVVDAVNHLSSLSLSAPLPLSSGGTGSNTGVNLQSSISGILPIANGGTGSATAVFNGSGITNLNATAISSGVIANTYTTANTANQSSAIVVRDIGGNFAANTITANLIGNVTGNVTGSSSLNVLSSAFTGANQSFTGNGYQKFPGGLIIQWGFVPDTGTTMSVTFPIAFPTACAGISAQIIRNSANFQSIAVSSPTTTGFNIYWDSNADGVNYIAIGY